jgi:antitoxin VapB
MATVISRVFMNGNSQAVRIPQEFRLDVNRVEIRRNDAGELVLRPIAARRGTALLSALRRFDDALTQDLVTRLEQARQEQMADQQRPAL